MRHYFRIYTIVFSLLAVSMVAVTPVSGDPLSDAVDWLLANQDASGLWGTDKDTPLRDAAFVIAALANAGESGQAVNNGAAAIFGQQTTTTDYLAHKVLALGPGNSGSTFQLLVDSLLGLANPDGGWGFARGYGSDVLDAGLAMFALGKAGISGITETGGGVSYIKSMQNPDGGWPLVGGEPSGVFYTSLALMGLNAHADNYSVTTEVDDGIAWLETQQNGDGGFGSDGNSNPYETGLALIALSWNDPEGVPAADARTYLESTQSPNGSWNNDAYSTALALLGLYENLGADSRPLGLYPGLNLIGLPLDPLTPTTSTDFCPLLPGCVGVTGWDRSAQDWLTGTFPLGIQDGYFVESSQMSNASVIGSPVESSECTDLQEGLNAISIPNENSSYSASVLMDEITSCTELHKWDAMSQRWQSYTVTRGDTVNGADFAAAPGEAFFARVTVGGEWCTHTNNPVLPDLFVTDGDLILSPNPVTAGQVQSMTARVQNIGDVEVSNPVIQFYQFDPDFGGSPIFSPITIPETVPPGGATGYYGYNLTWGGAGTADIYVKADPDNVIVELNETNNKTFVELVILPPAASSSAPNHIAMDGSGIKPSTDFQMNSALRKSGPAKGVGSVSLSTDSAAVSDVNVHNVTSSSATIVWLTDIETDGCVHFGESSIDENTECAFGYSGGVNYVTLTGLAATTEYVFAVEAGGTIDDNGGSGYSFTTVAIGAGVPSVIFGRVLDDEHDDRLPPPTDKADVFDFAFGAVVSVFLSNGADSSGSLSTVTGWDGTFVLNLGNLKDAATGLPYEYNAGDMVYIIAEGGSRGHTDTTVSLGAGSPQDVGELMLQVPAYVCGDANNSGGVVDIDDIIYIVNYVFTGGPIPEPYEAADANCSGFVDIDDIIFLVNYIFTAGPEPCDTDDDGIPDC
jgi:hypothetical protein